MRPSYTLAAACLLLPGADAQPVPAADWPMYNRDLRGSRYSPLAQINTRNVASLKQVWTYPLGQDSSAGGISGGTEFTPLVVSGVMYVATAKSVVALEAESGKEIWRYQLASGAPSRRGVAYWAATRTILPASCLPQAAR